LASKSYKQAAIYIAVLAFCFAAGMTAGWWGPLGGRLDHYAYDEMTKQTPLEGGQPQSVVVAVDERTLERQGGVAKMRPILTNALEQIAEAQPETVAIDVILHDAGDDAVDARLEAALRTVPRLILPCELVDGVWEDPLPRWKGIAAAIGHAERDVDLLDGVSRQIPLELSSGGQRRWAMALEAFRLSRNQRIIESPEDLQIGDLVVPAPRGAGNRPLLIRFLPEGTPRISVMDLAEKKDQLRGKTVFLGVTALSAAKDRLVNPYGEYVAGVEVHAHVFETLARGKFLTRAGNLPVVLTCLAFCVAAGLIFALLPGWAAYASSVVLLGASHELPVILFRHGTVFPYFASVAVAGLSVIGAATYQAFFVRRQLTHTESERTRYRSAIHWAAHEMRTPLTSIQGSSEIMARYNLPDQKRHQLSEMINSESKRLSKIIQTFLDVERLAEGAMELKKEPFAASYIVETCISRVAPLAERKRIELVLDSHVEGILTGDKELMEYAFYNLLTNAVKYSPAATRVRVFSQLKEGELRLAVEDQGMGMDAKELKNIFQKFYRTKRAEASGEMGTGIGLSIVDQIVTYHGGRIDVTSAPGKGSCFTMVLKASASAPTNEQTIDRRG
jgi:signal transduction histidine kinase